VYINISDKLIERLKRNFPEKSIEEIIISIIRLRTGDVSPPLATNGAKEQLDSESHP